MTRPLLLDLFCGAGGAAVGYHQAGFQVVGVDIEPQPNYPFTFIQSDVFDYLHSLSTFPFAAVHASPPCQSYTQGAIQWGTVDDHPRLVHPVRAAIMEHDVPYVIENVNTCTDLRSPVKLCGQMFRLGVFRHRLFETNFLLPQPTHMTHDGYVGDGFYYTVVGNTGGYNKGLIADWRKAMGINWMLSREIKEAIPPAYTSWIGQWLRAALRAS